MARVRVYRTYRFIDKDPIIDQLRTVLQDEGLAEKLGIVSDVSGVSATTLANWFKGDTKRPQHATLAAVATSCGYGFTFKRNIKGRFDVDAEIAKAKRWRKEQKAKREAELEAARAERAARKQAAT